MAKLPADRYKPPMLFLEYREQIYKELSTNTDNVSTNTTDSYVGPIPSLLSSPVDSGTPGIKTISKFEGGLDKTITDATDCYSTSVNETVNKIKSNTSLGMSKSGCCWADFALQVDKSKYVKQGYAAIRKNVSKGVTEQTYAPSILDDPSDLSPHIRVAKNIVGAAPPCNDREGVEWVYPGVFRSDSPTSQDQLYDGGSGDITVYPRRITGVHVDDPTLEDGNGKYQVIILDTGSVETYTTPDTSQGIRYCVVKYYSGWDATIEDGTIVKPEQPIETEGEVTIGGTLLDKNRNAPVDSGKIGETIYTLDFAAISSHPDKFGFGVERFNFSGDSRKSVQQTRGTQINAGENVKDNFYVDTWWKGPESISLVGAIELPYGYETTVLLKNTGSGEKPVKESVSYGPFLEALEQFFFWNNNPNRVNKGDYMVLRDTYREQEYKVTFKSRSYTQDVGRQSVVGFELNFIVLDSSKISS